ERVRRPERRERGEVALRVRLPVDDVVGRYDRVEAVGETGGGDDGLDLVARRAGADRERHALCRVAHGLARVLVDRRAVADRGAVTRDALLDHGVDVRMLASEPRAHDLRI